MVTYFYEKRYVRHDGSILARRYSRSFERGQKSEHIQPELSNGNSSSNSFESSISRARNKIRVLAFSNTTLTGLLTLTFKDIPTEQEALSRFKLYRQQVSRYYKGWQFLGVKELQKRGSIHFHLLVNFCPAQVHKPLSNRPLQQQSELWTYGISDFRLIEGDDKFRVELYLLKYLTKNTEKLFKTYYHRSRNLLNPKVMYIKNRVELPPNAELLFTRHISNNSVDHFVISEYIYNHNNNNERH